MARTVWSNVTLSTTSDMAVVEPNIASWGVTAITDKCTLAKDEIARRLRQQYSEYKTLVDPKEDGDDMVSTASSVTVSSAGSSFLTQKVSTYDKLWIETGSDIGVHNISTVSTTTLGLSATLTTAATGLSFHIAPEVLDLIKNPNILTSAAVFLGLHYSALELATEVGQYWDQKQDVYWRKFEETLKLIIPDLELDFDQDDIIENAERRSGITGGRLIR